jgi:hypothetical protein
VTVPQLALRSFPSGNSIPLVPLTAPRVQLRCWVRVPGFATPRDGIVDTGSPFSWVPEAIWQRFVFGTDYEWLPYAPGYVPPRTNTAGWSFSFRFARLLVPLVLLDSATAFPRCDVIAQFADGNPAARGSAPSYLVLGLWGGVFEGTRLVFGPGPTPTAALEW